MIGPLDAGTYQPLGLGNPGRKDVVPDEKMVMGPDAGFGGHLSKSSSFQERHEKPFHNRKSFLGLLHSGTLGLALSHFHGRSMDIFHALPILLKENLYTFTTWHWEGLVLEDQPHRVPHLELQRQLSLIELS